MREHSIRLFQAAMKAVLRHRKKEMKRTVHNSLLPLYLHMGDQSESVAKVQISELTSYVGEGVPTPQGCSWGALASSVGCLRRWLSRVLALAIEPSAHCLSPTPPQNAQGKARTLPRGGARGSPSRGCGAISQPLLLHRPLGKLWRLLPSFCDARSSNAWPRHSSPGRSGSAW